MVSKKFPKAMRGQQFKVEVAFVAPPEVLPSPPRIGEPCTLETAVLGFPAGTEVEFRLFEPHRLHEDPVDTVTGQTGEEDRVVQAQWTLDWAAKKDELSAAHFVCVARCGNFLNVSAPFSFVDRLESTLQDAAGKPLANRQVRLRPTRGELIDAVTDADGKLALDVPPGDYRIEVLA